ncbi:hypothetical protein MPSEU_000924900 [Mayamaea pseudoterrestris]|nr:hypothetical protein MPSEU_000924900 [Mayamaea pseudoterrestris]
MSDHLMNFFFETLISLAVPAVVGLIGLFVAAKILRPSRNRKRNADMDNEDSALSSLYSDLYGDQERQSSNNNDKSLLKQLFGMQSQSSNNLPKNVGVPALEYITIKNVNLKLQSYQYSLTAATQTKAKAASDYRNEALRLALSKSLASGKLSLTNH